ncbi:MAG: ZIP family metal transporter [Firmicutes bacterium]|nr:ZIP family metal transporter [Bacillota bacterium]
MLEVILFAAMAGLLGSVAGVIIVFFVKNPSKELIGIGFAFSAAVLVALAFIDFIPHALGEDAYYYEDAAGIWWTFGGLVVGFGIIFLFRLIHNRKSKDPEHTSICVPTGLVVQDEGVISPIDKRRMILAGLAVGFAVILHDFPKGLAIGVAGTWYIAILIGLSCLPEGVAMSAPLKASGMKKWKILGMLGLAALSPVLGAMLGFWLGGINEIVEGVMFALAAGCIIGVVFMEMLPMSYQYSKRRNLNAIAMLIGVVLVITLHYFLHDLVL